MDKQIDGTEFACLTINADLEAENEKLKKKLAITEKALELACERYWNDCGLEDCPYGESTQFDKSYEKCRDCPNDGDMFVNNKGCCWIEYFKQQAEKEMLVNE